MKLTDICDFQGGSQPPKEEWSYEKKPGYIRMLQIRDFTQSEKVTPEYIKLTKNTKVCESDDILIARYGASLGKILTGQTGAYNVAIMRTIPDTKKLKKKYLFYYLKSPYFQSAILSVGVRAAQAGFNKEDLSKLDIDCPSFEKQDFIISTLGKAEAIIAERHQQLSALDDLIKARFVEMFGDPEIGTCQFQTERLGDLSVKISDGVHAKPDYTESGRPFLSVVNINKGVVDFTDCKYVSEEAYQKMIKSTHPQKGDVLYTKVGATYGIPAYVDTDREFCLYVSVCLIKPMHEKINARFLALQMSMPSVKHQADARVKGIGVPDLHLNQISEFRIILPPRDLQDTFVRFAEQVDISKATIQKSLDKTQLLFDSLMQEYFG